MKGFAPFRSLPAGFGRRSTLQGDRGLPPASGRHLPARLQSSAARCSPFRLMNRLAGRSSGSTRHSAMSRPRASSSATSANCAPITVHLNSSRRTGRPWCVNSSVSRRSRFRFVSRRGRAGALAAEFSILQTCYFSASREDLWGAFGGGRATDETRIEHGSNTDRTWCFPIRLLTGVSLTNATFICPAMPW